MAVRLPKSYAAASAVLLGFGLVQVAAPPTLRAQMFSDMKQSGTGLQGTKTEPRPDSVDNPTANLVADVMRIWSGDPDLDADTTTQGVQVAARAAGSRSLAIPLLASSTRQLLPAGKRPFHLVWIGGKPPFNVTLLGPDGESVADWSTSQHSAASTLDLQEGSYEVHVTDASGREVLGAFEVTAQAPSVSQEGTGQLPADYKSAILAARLAAVDDGAWRMAAYEQLVTGPAGDATRLTASRLAHGLPIADLLGQQSAVR